MGTSGRNWLLSFYARTAKRVVRNLPLGHFSGSIFAISALMHALGHATVAAAAGLLLTEQMDRSTGASAAWVHLVPSTNLLRVATIIGVVGAAIKAVFGALARREQARLAGTFAGYARDDLVARWLAP